MSGQVITVDWNKMFSQKDFWQVFFDYKRVVWQDYYEQYFNLEEDVEYTLSELAIFFPGHFELIFSSYLSPYFQHLELSKNGKDRELLGWDDTLQQWPDVFRIEEMHAILQCLHEQPRNELPVDFKYVPLLLRKFTPATKENSEQLLRETAEFIYRTGLFSRQESEELALKRHYIQEDFTWWFDEERGWVKKGEDGYSFRYYDPEDTYEYEGEEFNFALLREFMRTVHKCAGIEDALV